MSQDRFSIISGVLYLILLVLIVGIDKPEKEPFKSGEQEPWVHRGGLLAEFRVSSSTLYRSLCDDDIDLNNSSI